MRDHFRRILFAIVVFALALTVFGLVRSRQPGYGLLDLLAGKRPGHELFTPQTGEKLTLDDVRGLAALDEEYTRLSTAVLPSVVSVNTKTVVNRRGWVQYGPFRLPGITQGEEAGIGSGAIISKEGHVVTNWHVIQGAKEVRVTTNDNKVYSAHVIDGSPNRDIALLKIDSDSKDFPALSFADSDKARVGQVVFAVGNPFGLSGTVTQGIISARDRHLSDSHLDYLQTDTVINPGNSGGPLVNIRGEILGINVAIYRGDQNVQAWQGVGLAVPANEAKAVVDNVLALKAGKGDRNAARGYLGLVLEDQALQINLPDGRSLVGVLVQQTNDNSPAMQAGLLPGDVILEFNGQPMTNAADLLKMIQSTRPGSKFALTVWRNGVIGKVNGAIGTPPA